MKTKTIKYKVTFEKAPEYDACYEVSLNRSGVFNYGNGTCILVTRNGFTDDVLDTRYLNLSDFDTWCDRYMAGKFNKDLCPCISRI